MIKSIIRNTAKNFNRRVDRKLKPIKPSRVAEAAYKSDLLTIVNQLKDLDQGLLKYLVDTEVQEGYVVGDSRESDLRKKIRELSAKFAVGNAEKIASSTANRVKENVDSRLRQELKRSVSIDIGPVVKSSNLTPAIALAVKENVALIKSIPEQHFQKLEEHITNALVSGQRASSLKDVIQRVGEITTNRAKFIARDQVSKMNGSFNKIRQTGLGINSYIWSTSQDERVRPTHQENEGKKFRWDDPPVDTGNPGEDYNCRCVAIPVFDLDEEEQKISSLADNQVLYSHEGTNYTKNLVPQFIKSAVQTAAQVEKHDTKQTEAVLNLLRKHDIYDPNSMVIQDVPISELSTVQSVVETNKLSRMANAYKEKSDVVVWQLPGGRKILHNGNHRVNAAIKNGKTTIKAKVLIFN